MHVSQINRCYTKIREFKGSRVHVKEILARPFDPLTLIFIIASLISFIPASIQAEALNLSGSIGVDYNSTVSTIETGGAKAESRSSDFIQRYNLNGSGIMVDPRLASYSANISFTDSQYRKDPASGESITIDRETLTYSLQMGLIPTRTPISLFAQRNELTTEDASDLISETYSIGWYAGLRTLTTLRLTLLQIGSEYEDPVNPRNTRIRISNLGLTQRFRTGSVSANYQYTDYLINTPDEETSSSVNSYNFRGDTRLSPSLLLNGNLTYFPKGTAYTPGITTTTETTGGIGLIHQVERFTQDGNYDFRKTQGGEIEKDTISYNMNYRPLGKTDYRTGAIYSSTQTGQTDTDEYRVSGGISHRPFYGLTLTGNMILHHFDVSGITESRTDRIGTMAGVNYYKLFDLFNLNSSYTGDYSLILSDQEESEGSIITNTGSIALQSRTLTVAQILGSYTILLRENNIVETDDRQEQVIRLEATSSYFRRWLLHASTSLSNTLHIGNTFLFDTRAEYLLGMGTRLGSGYRLSDYPGETNAQDSQSYYLEGQHLRSITRRLNMNLTARGEREELRYTDRDRVTFSSLFEYQIGRINLSFEFKEDYTKYPESVYNTQSYFVRASRPF